MKNPFFKACFFFISISLFSCHEDKNPCRLGGAILKDIAKVDSLTKLPKVRERDNIWLTNYQESSLVSAQYETYRFIWASSFDGVKIFRVEKVNGKYKAVVKTFRDHDNIKPIIREFSVSSKTWSNIVDKLSIDGFWTYFSSIERNGLDGATWTLEGYKPIRDKCTGKNYHRLTRWSPVDTTFIAMCNLFSSMKQE